MQAINGWVGLAANEVKNHQKIDPTNPNLHRVHIDYRSWDATQLNQFLTSRKVALADDVFQQGIDGQIYFEMRMEKQILETMFGRKVTVKQIFDLDRARTHLEKKRKKAARDDKKLVLATNQFLEEKEAE